MITAEELEQLKATYEIDRLIAEKHKIPQGRVEAEFDPRLIRLIRDYLRKKGIEDDK